MTARSKKRDEAFVARLARARVTTLAHTLDRARCLAGRQGLHDLARDIVSLVVKYKLPADYEEEQP